MSAASGSGPARAPVLILGWGNLSRGDDALGPLCVQEAERLATAAGRDGSYVECATDFQLQVEYALDLCGRERVLFVDAARGGPEPYAAARLDPAWDSTYTTHELSPAALLHVCRTVVGEEPPPAWLLGIRGYAWELGDPLTGRARDNLAAAVTWLEGWLAEPSAGSAGSAGSAMDSLAAGS